MAKRRRGGRAARCKIVTINRKRRKLCWSAKGRLISNKKA